MKVVRDENEIIEIMSDEEWDKEENN